MGISGWKPVFIHIYITLTLLREGFINTALHEKKSMKMMQLILLDTRGLSFKTFNTFNLLFHSQFFQASFKGTPESKGAISGCITSVSKSL